MLAGCVRFPLVADLPEFNELLLPGANTSIVPHLAEVLYVQTMQMIPVGNDSKAQEGKRWEGGTNVLAENCIQEGTSGRDIGCDVPAVAWCDRSMACVLQKTGWNEGLRIYMHHDNSQITAVNFSKPRKLFGKFLHGGIQTPSRELEVSRGETTKSQPENYLF